MSSQAITKYHLTPLSARLLELTVLVPIAATWFAAFYGFNKLNQYSQLIGTKNDGKHIHTLTKGLLVLAIIAPISSIALSILDVVAERHTSFRPIAVILENYISLLIPFVAFLFINYGARGLGVLTKKRSTWRMLNTIALTVICLGVTYCYLVFGSSADPRTVYHLPMFFITLTIIVPYMYVWFIGLHAASEIHLYSKHIAGILYRRSWNLLALGLGAIILTSISVQYLMALSAQLNHLSLSGVLAVLYLLLLLNGASYLLVALGAKKLIKIEEV